MVVCCQSAISVRTAGEHQYQDPLSALCASSHSFETWNLCTVQYYPHLSALISVRAVDDMGRLATPPVATNWYRVCYQQLDPWCWRISLWDTLDRGRVSVTLCWSHASSLGSLAAASDAFDAFRFRAGAFALFTTLANTAPFRVPLPPRLALLTGACNWYMFIDPKHYQGTLQRSSIDCSEERATQSCPRSDGN